MSKSQSVTLNGKRYDLNPKGFLTDPSAWDTRLRDWFAEQEKITMTGEHLQVIDFLRAYYEKHTEHPVVRMIAEEMAGRLGPQKGTIKYFHRLFPAGIHQAYRIAGLPMKHSCC